MQLNKRLVRPLMAWGGFTAILYLVVQMWVIHWQSETRNFESQVAQKQIILNSLSAKASELPDLKTQIMEIEKSLVTDFKFYGVKDSNRLVTAVQKSIRTIVSKNKGQIRSLRILKSSDSEYFQSAKVQVIFQAIAENGMQILQKIKQNPETLIIDKWQIHNRIRQVAGAKYPGKLTLDYTIILVGLMKKPMT
ncbi:MAG: hypothetical protein COB29_14720 [Sulfitobacter sp.]|nr:MAG: hypothetical protein COB29_14720 [Sulfitobacter sp.]